MSTRLLLVLALTGLTVTSCSSNTVVPRFDASGSDASTTDGGHDAATDVDGGARGTVTIFQIQDAEATGHVSVGASVRVEGAMIAAIDAYEENGVGMGNVTDVWVVDPTGGPFSGVHVYMPAHTECPDGGPLRIGDTVDVTGTVQEFAVPSDGSGRTVTQLVGATVTCVTTGTAAMPSPHAIADPATLTSDASAEAWEGVLVELSDVEATADPDRFGTQALRIGPPIDDDLYAHAGTRRDRFETVRGIFHYMFGHWEILPRSATDIVLGAPRTTEDESGAWGCGDDEDSDGDGEIDCADADCSGSPFCRGDRVHVEDVQDATRAMHPPADTDVALFGPLVVTSIDSFAEMAGAGYVGTIVVQDAEALDPRHSGIHVFVPEIEPCGPSLELGDRVYVAGHYDEYAEAGDTGTLTEIRGGIVSCRMPGTELAPTVIATPTDLGSAATAEPWEGVLVEIGGVDVTMPAGMYGRFQVAGSVYVDDDVYRATVTAGDRIARLTGVLTYAFEHQLEPRRADDVVLGPSEHDDARCSNGTDDDGDGATDCSDLDCCATTACNVARRLVLSEVVYDAASADDTHEWVELRNAGTTPLPLACYALGNGAVSYRYSLAQLPPIVVPPGGCVLIGGPDCGGTTCTSDLDFEPDFHNGTAGSASGVAVFYSLASAVTDATIPVDAVLYGTTNTAMLRDRTGAVPATAHVADVAAGHSIARAGDGTWMDLAAPTPGACTTYTP